MAKYLVETYYTCTFKVNHYLEDVNETELKNLEKNFLNICKMQSKKETNIQEKNMLKQ